MRGNRGADTRDDAARPRCASDSKWDKKQRGDGNHKSVYFGGRALAMASSKRWASEGDLASEAPARKHRRRELASPGCALVTLVTTDGAAMVLDVSPRGRFAARFRESHLLDPGDPADADPQDGSRAKHREIVLPVDRSSLVPVYAYVTIDGTDFGSRGALDTNALISSSLCLCVGRLDAIQTAADAIGVPAAAACLRRWVDLAAPDPTSFTMALETDARGVVLSCSFAPHDPAALVAEMGPEAAKRLCAAVARERLGADASPLVRYVTLARLDEPLRARIARARDDADVAGAGCAPATCVPLQRRMPFLLATGDLPDVDGACARSRCVLGACCDEGRANALAGSLDDLCHLARDMPERVRVDNPYHIMAALASRSGMADSDLGAKALAAAVDGDTHLLGLLADAARLALGTPHAIRALTDIHLHGLCLDPYQLHKVDQAICAHYDGDVDPARHSHPSAAD